MSRLETSDMRSNSRPSNTSMHAQKCVWTQTKMRGGRKQAAEVGARGATVPFRASSHIVKDVGGEVSPEPS